MEKVTDKGGDVTAGQLHNRKVTRCNMLCFDPRIPNGATQSCATCPSVHV